jgi:hypothetical protein
MSKKNGERTQRIIQWVTGGKYAVAVEVEAVFPADDPSEPCLTPTTVRFLEDLSDRAEAGDVEALRHAGTVYTRIPERDTVSTAMVQM